AECAKEVRSLTAMRKAVIAVGDAAPEPSPFMLNRALAEIEDYERGRAEVEKSQAEKSGKWLRHLSAAWEDWFGETTGFVRVALAAQMALVLAVGSVAIYQHNHPQTLYQVLTANSGEGALIAVRFNETASEREIRQALEGVNGTIVGGPSAQRMYTVALK